jgi:hypothetical protein
VPLIGEPAPGIHPNPKAPESHQSVLFAICITCDESFLRSGRVVVSSQRMPGEVTPRCRLKATLSTRSNTGGWRRLWDSRLTARSILRPRQSVLPEPLAAGGTFAPVECDSYLNASPALIMTKLRPSVQAACPIARNPSSPTGTFVHLRGFAFPGLRIIGPRSKQDKIDRTL